MPCAKFVVWFLMAWVMHHIVWFVYHFLECHHLGEWPNQVLLCMYIQQYHMHESYTNFQNLCMTHITKWTSWLHLKNSLGNIFTQSSIPDGMNRCWVPNYIYSSLIFNWIFFQIWIKKTMTMTEMTKKTDKGKYNNLLLVWANLTFCSPQLREIDYTCSYVWIWIRKKYILCFFSASRHKMLLMSSKKNIVDIMSINFFYQGG